MKIYTPQIIGTSSVDGPLTIGGRTIISGTLDLGSGTLFNQINIENANGTANNLSADGNSNNIIIIGTGNTANKGEDLLIGQNNNTGYHGNGQANRIIGNNNTMSNGGNKSNNLILGLSNTLNHDGDARTLVGVSHTTAAASSNGGIFAGFQNTLSHDRSVVIGGGGIATEANNTVYVPNFVATGSATIRANAIVTGSLTVNGSITGNGGFTGSLLGTASFATTAATASFYSLAAVTQNAVFSGSVRGEVRTLTITSNTASLDCSLDNFFTLQLVEGTDTRINPTNINPGQIINLRINTTGSATVSFPTSVLQPSGSAYVPTTTTGVDVITLRSFDATTLYLNSFKDFI